MLTIGGRSAAAVYADALLEKGSYVVARSPDVVTVWGNDGGWLKVYLVDESHIHCRMQGQPWNEQELTSLLETWNHLPYSLLVATAVMEKASWLDENPGYRGIPVKQSGRKPYISER